ncbi:MAG: hypothetical protein HN348_16930 [Proteobacteria bacterium]|jgi:hypothetical protein|nr:hypothetical protein [Pseudomonadota bacterium]
MLPQGRVTVQTVKFDDDMMPLGFETSEWTWALEKTTLVLTVPKGASSRYVMTGEGSLKPVEGGDSFGNLPDDCSA